MTVEFSDWRPAIRSLAPDAAIAAIGDVHGQDDLFAALLGELARDLTARSTRPVIVQLGDLVDRGPGSIASLKRARLGIPGVELVALMGNHEELMLHALFGDDKDAARWFDSGGLTTLAEAGLTPSVKDWRTKLRTEIGDGVLSWLANLPSAHRIDSLLFVHAGINPAEPMSRQDRHTLMWTRSPFIESPGPYAEGLAVIHGHTPQRTVDLGHPHRVNLDTGAFHTGLLSALVIVGDRMRLAHAMR